MPSSYEWGFQPLPVFERDVILKALEQERVEQIQARRLLKLCGKSPIVIIPTQEEKDLAYQQRLAAYQNYLQSQYISSARTWTRYSTVSSSNSWYISR